MNAIPVERPRAVVQELVNQHGRLRVFVMALAALLRPPSRRATPTSDRALSNHLRRDIGLGPNAAPQKTWEHYR